MIKTIFKATVVSALLAGPSFADEAAINGRQSLMGLYNFNAGILFSMAQGKTDYNADVASAAASNLAAASKINQMSMWPQGTDNVAMAGKTRAKPDIWTTFPAILENAEQLTIAADAAAAVSSNGLDALKAAIGPVGAACQACHKANRGPKP